MRSHSAFGGRHELGQNFLHSHRTIRTIASLTADTAGPILEIGPGTGAVTAELYKLGRPLTLVELDETRIDHLEHRFPRAQVRHADALTAPFDVPVIVGNVPFHLTTPILRRLLQTGTWQTAILLTQWEVARKRAGVGGSTMLTAQWAPWYDFRLIERVPAHAFAPKPSVDGGVLTIERSAPGLIPARRRSDYQQFVRAAFTGRGRGMKGILTQMKLTDRPSLQSVMKNNEVEGDALPRDLTPEQWSGLYSALSPEPKKQQPSKKPPRKKQSKKHNEKETTVRNTNAAKKNMQPEPANPKPAMPKSEKSKPTKEESAMSKSEKSKSSWSDAQGAATKHSSGTKQAAGGSVLDPGAFGTLPPITGEIPAVAEKPVITGEIPIVGADPAAKGLHAPLPGLEAKPTGHDKAHLNAERGFRPQHKKAQPQPRWNLPRRQG